MPDVVDVLRSLSHTVTPTRPTRRSSPPTSPAATTR